MRYNGLSGVSCAGGVNYICGDGSISDLIGLVVVVVSLVLVPVTSSGFGVEGFGINSAYGAAGSETDMAIDINIVA